MPRNTPRRNQRWTHSASADVKLEHFADANKNIANCTRLKKGALNTVGNQQRALRGSGSYSAVMSEEMEEVAWFDKDLEEFEIPSDEKGINEESSTRTDKKGGSKRNISRKLHPQHECNTGLVYHTDLWFLLSQYIYPETVGTYARLCKMSYSVTHTIQFWRNLYYRYYHESQNLPEDLQPFCLERVHGLRQRVIRALFHLYPLLSRRTTTTIPFEDEHHSLVGLRCIVMWYEPVKNLWNFNFKLRKERISDINKLVTIKSTQRDKNLNDGYCDVYSNVENDCYLLQVTCQSFQNVTSVMGLVLSNISLKVGQCMRYHCLRLHFDSSMKSSSNLRGKCSDIVVTLDPVINLKVFPWWHPKYPLSG